LILRRPATALPNFKVEAGTSYGILPDEKQPDTASRSHGASRPSYKHFVVFTFDEDYRGRMNQISTENLVRETRRRESVEIRFNGIIVVASSASRPRFTGTSAATAY
jgi:hypothetical protein